MSNEERTVIFQLPTVVSGSLACMEGSVSGKTWRLSAGTFVIGRSDESDLHLPSEPGVSKVHAKVLAEGDHYVLEDNESRNGTIVNGHVVRRVMLADGDELQICGCRLRFTQTGGEGRRGDVVPDAAPASQPPRAASVVPQAAAPVVPPASQASSQGAGAFVMPPQTEAFDPSTDVVPRIIDDSEVEGSPAKKSGGSLIMPFFMGLFFVLLLGGLGTGALLFLGGDDDGTAVASSGGDGAANGGREADVASPAASSPAGEAGGEAPTTEVGEPSAAEPTAEAPTADPTTESGADIKKTATDEPAATSPEGDAPIASPEAATPGEEFVAVVVESRTRTAIRTRGGGRVRSVEVQNGEQIKRGASILRLDDIALGREIATVVESVNALAEIAETSEGASAALADEKAKLKALQSQARQQRVSAPATGALAGLTVRAGDRVRPRQVIGFVRSSDMAPFAVIARTEKQKWSKGAGVEVKLNNGDTATGAVAGTSVASGKTLRVPLDVKGVKPDDISGARLR